MAGRERELEDLAFLTSPEAGEILRQALGADAIVRSWQLHSQHHRPGGGVSVGYSVVAEHRGLDGARSTREHYICLSTAKILQPVSRVGRFAWWEFPFDPELPALKVACSPARMSEALGEQVQVELLSYRPTRRAIIRAKTARGAVIYVKVVRPAKARSLLDRYKLLHEGGTPCPQVVYSTADGLIATAHVQGVPLSGVLAAGMGVYASSIFTSLTDCLDTLPQSLMRIPRQPAWSDRIEHYAFAASAVLPTELDRCQQIAEGVASLMRLSDPGPLVPVHGDFYEANVVMSPSGHAARALLDVDGVGPGHRVDDIACLLAHTSVLPHVAPATYTHVAAELPVWVERAEQECDPVALNARCAGVALSLVAGSKRATGTEWMVDAVGRLETAEAWLARARAWYEARRSGSLYIPRRKG